MASRLLQNCRSKNCVVCVSRIDSILLKIDSILLKIDSIVINRLDWKNRLDLRHVRFDCQHNWLGQKNRLDAKLSTRSCATFHSMFTDSTLFESILQQSGRSFSNRVDSATPTAATWDLTTPTGHAVSKACLVPDTHYAWQEGIGYVGEWCTGLCPRYGPGLVPLGYVNSLPGWFSLLFTRCSVF